MKECIKRFLYSRGYRLEYYRNKPRRFAFSEDLLEMNLDFAIARAVLHRKDLFFVQIGAYDGQMCDPLKDYIKRLEWCGIMVEPQPGPYAHLQRVYKNNRRIKLENAAISDRCGESPFYTVSCDGQLPDWCAALASFDREHLLKHAPQVRGLEEQIVELRVKTVTFGELFRRNNVTRVDILQIDTEGFDAEIIAMYPFEELCPVIVNFEKTHLSIDSIDRALDRLASFEYTFAYSGSQDILAFREASLNDDLIG
jgi:FkbM family methyltransferase